MKAVKKILPIVIGALVIAAYVFFILTCVSSVLKGKLLVVSVLIALMSLINGIKALKVFFSELLNADVTNYSAQKACIKLVKRVAGIFVVASFASALSMVSEIAKIIADHDSSWVSDIQKSWLVRNTIAFICPIVGSIVAAIGVGKKADDAPVRTSPAVAGLVIIFASKFLMVNTALSSLGAWLITVAAIATIVSIFLKPIKEEAKEEVVEEVAATEETKAE